MISGWQASGIYQGQSGAALGFGNAIFLGNLRDIPIPNGRRTVDRWFNVMRDLKEFRAAAQPEPADFKYPLSGNPRRWSQQPGSCDHQEHAAQGRRPAPVAL